jgi:hypothetical protein
MEFSRSVRHSVYAAYPDFQYRRFVLAACSSCFRAACTCGFAALVELTTDGRWKVAARFQLEVTRWRDSEFPISRDVMITPASTIGVTTTNRVTKVLKAPQKCGRCDVQVRLRAADGVKAVGR